MGRSPLFGRRIHIAGSVAVNQADASTEDVDDARELVEALIPELVKRGASFVVPVDAEKLRPCDQRPICFDWLVWRCLHDSIPLRPGNAPNPLAVAIEHHKTEEQIPLEFHDLWDSLRGSDLIQIENVSHWNMASKRLEAQARSGDVLLALGGSEGVLFLANLYHDAGKPVVPLRNAVTPPDTGARRLFALGLSTTHSERLFRSSGVGAHTWINRINFTSRDEVSRRVERIISLLESLESPRAFVVRLLNPEHADYDDVEAFFDIVVRPLVEDELGYKVVVVDGRQPLEFPRLDEEIFAKLHRSSVVLADITGLRPNCLLELGYALGRGTPTMVMVKEGAEHPFDIATVAGLRWKPTGSVAERRRQFMEHWTAIRTRPPLVPSEPLIP